MASHTHFVSVILPVYDDEARLKIVLQALEQQTYPADAYEVIVVDNASPQSPEELVEQFPHARLAYKSKPGSYAARNLGVSIAKGEFLAFTDADCLPCPEWILAGMEALTSQPQLGLVAGEIILQLEQPGRPNMAEIYETVTSFRVRRAARLGFAYTANAFTHKKVFELVGAFNEELKSRGDFEWGQRVFEAGLPVTYSAEANVQHPARSTMKEQILKRRRLLGGRLEMQRKNKWEFEGGTAQKVLPWWTKIVPPLTAYWKESKDPKLTTLTQRFKFLGVSAFLHYITGFERVRLLLGGKTERR